MIVLALRISETFWWNDECRGFYDEFPQSGEFLYFGAQHIGMVIKEKFFDENLNLCQYEAKIFKFSVKSYSWGISTSW